MKDIMVDLETLSLESNGCIVSIGAVWFDVETGELGDEFHMKLNILEQAVNGADINKDTLKWWETQSVEAKKALCSGKEVSVKFALDKFNQFVDIGVSVGNLRLWGNGAGFDNVLLRNLYKRSFTNFVIPFWCDCDVRTITNFMSREEKQAIKFEGTKHDAIADCKHQIKLVVAGRHNGN